MKTDAEFDLAHDRAAEPDRKRVCGTCSRKNAAIELEQARNCDHWYCPEHTHELHQHVGVCESMDCARAELNRLINAESAGQMNRLKVTLLLSFKREDIAQDIPAFQDAISRWIELSPGISVDQCIAHWTSLGSKKERK